MALIVFVKGVNVGGHRRLRPAELARSLHRLDVVNVGAAGTFVVRKPISKTNLRTEIARRLPFEAEIMICSGSDILRFADTAPFDKQSMDPSTVCFVSPMAKRPTAAPALPLDLPSSADWCVRILGCHERFAFGLYRRQMRTIRYLEQVEKVFGVATTTRNWQTIQTIVRIVRG